MKFEFCLWILQNINSKKHLKNTIINNLDKKFLRTVTDGYKIIEISRTKNFQNLFFIY